MNFVRRHPWLCAAAAVFAVAFGVVKIATSPPSLRLVTERLTARLEAELGLSLRIGELRVDPTTAGIELGPVSVIDLDGIEVFSAERIRLELAPLRFLSRRLQLDSLEVEAPRVWVRVDEQGRLKGVRLAEATGTREEALLRVDVKRFRLFEGQVRVVQEGKVDAELRGISMRMRGHDDDSHQLRFRIAGGSITRPHDVIALERFGGLMAVYGDGLLSPDRINLSEVLLVAESASVSIGGDIRLEERGEMPAFDLDINALVPLAPVLAHASLPVEVEGAVSVGARVMADSGLARPRATGQADVVDLRVQGFGIGSLSGRFVADEDRAEFLSVAHQTGGTTLQGEAVFSFDESLAFQVRVSGADFSLHRLLADLKIPGSWTDLLMDAEAVGHGVLRPSFDLQGRVRGQIHDLRVGGADVTTLSDEQLVVSAREPILSDFEFHATTEKLRLTGTLDDPWTSAEGFVDLYFQADKGFVVELESDRVSFESIGGRIGKLDFRGAGGAQLRIAGPYRRPDIQADAWLNGFTLEDFTFGDLEGHIHYDAGVLALEELRARRGPSLYSGDVTLDFVAERELRRAEPESSEPHPFTTVRGLAIDVDIALDRARAEDLRAVIPPRYDDGVLGFLRELEFTGPLTGLIRSQGYIGDGTTDHLTGTGELTLDVGTTLLGQTLRGGSGRFRLDLDRFSIEGMNLAMAGGTTVVTATIERDGGKIDGDVVIRGLQLGQLDALTGTSREFVGTLNLEGTLSHLAQDPTLIGRARLEGAAWGDLPIGGADLAVSHVGRKLSLLGPILSRRGDGVIAVETRSPFPYTASLHLFAGDVEPLLPPALLPDGMRLEAAGTVDVGGELGSFSESRGTIALEPALVTLRTLTLRATGDVLAHFRGSRITIDQLELASQRGDAVSLRGVVSADEVDLSLSTRGEMWFLPAFVPRLEGAGGRLELDLAITGDLEKASMLGQGRVASGRFDLDFLDDPLEDVSARLLFRGPNVLIESMRGTIGQAPVKGQGSVTLSGLRPAFYDVDFQVRELPLRIPSWLPTRSSGRLSIRGDAALPTLAGELDVHEAIYREDINWERALPDLRRRTTEVQVFDKAEEDLKFDIHLIADDGVRVENNVLDVEAKGDLYLVGTDERPGLRGTLSLLRGNANFRGNRYRLGTGTIDFVETYRIAPVVDIRAETSVKGYDLAARVSGPLSREVQIALSSRPELAEIDILALLTFGFTQQELQDANNAGAGAGAGLEMVGAYTGLNEEVRRILPESFREKGFVAVDELRLTSVFSERQGASVPAVALSVELNPGLLWGLADQSRLRLQSTLVDTGGSGPEQRVEWEKRFDNDVRFRFVWRKQDAGLGGQASQTGDFGADAWYRWEF